ncbi:MAG TPA: hypothetical protein VEL31_25000, partial [Ktedonobacteraceae bacterium]|nr:hypothetical protein [Ktedonobacteraceae bacterium]
SPEKERKGEIVGTWYDVEPGTNPAFLYQQNTLRDALVAGLPSTSSTPTVSASRWPILPRQSTSSRR